MILLAAASIATAMPQSRPVTAAVQATATIRVVSAVRLKLDGEPNPGAPPARDSTVKSADGTSQPAKLIEFQ
jgi:hypothetical protein